MDEPCKAPEPGGDLGGGQALDRVRVAEVAHDEMNRGFIVVDRPGVDRHATLCVLGDRHVLELSGVGQEVSDVERECVLVEDGLGIPDGEDLLVQLRCVVGQFVRHGEVPLAGDRR